MLTRKSNTSQHWSLLSTVSFIFSSAQNGYLTKSRCGSAMILPHPCLSGTLKLRFSACIWGIVWFCTKKSHKIKLKIIPIKVQFYLNSAATFYIKRLWSVKKNQFKLESRQTAHPVLYISQIYQVDFKVSAANHKISVLLKGISHLSEWETA